MKIKYLLLPYLVLFAATTLIIGRSRYPAETAAYLFREVTGQPHPKVQDERAKRFIDGLIERGVVEP